MYAGSSISQSTVVLRGALPTACRKLIYASTDRSGLQMLAQDLSRSGRPIWLHGLQATCHFGRPRYCTAFRLTPRSLAVRADPRLSDASIRLSGASTASTCFRHLNRLHVRASTIDKVTEASTNQHRPPKFSKRTCVKDVKVTMLW